MEVYECILSLIAGVGVFILAMKLMSDSLTQLAGEKLKNLLHNLAGNRIMGVLLGAGVTAIIQSSSATTVMVIGFVNANVMSLKQAASIIIGSNIGTTVTGLLASLESLNITLYLSLLTFIGVMLAFIKRFKKIANLLTGLGMIFIGLKLMSSACDDESIKNSFTEVLKEIDFPLFLISLGIIFTAIIQSSSAMTGIVIVMVGNKVMSLKNGLFITLGANVGTCVTALISIIGANMNSKRTAVIHLTFNISGCLIFAPLLWIFSDSIINVLEYLLSKQEMQIALFHLFFNITTACIMTPLIKYLCMIAEYVVKEESTEFEQFEPFLKEKKSLGIRNSTRDIRESSNKINIKIDKDEGFDDEIIDIKKKDSKDSEIDVITNNTKNEKNDEGIEVKDIDKNENEE